VDTPQTICSDPSTLTHKTVSVSSPLVSFDGLNDNTIKDLTCLLNVEQVIIIVIYICDVMYCINHYEPKLKLKGTHAWYFICD
jgi:hypothetical protein